MTEFGEGWTDYVVLLQTHKRKNHFVQTQAPNIAQKLKELELIDYRALCKHRYGK
jgi:hypothetical protein